MLYSNSVDKSDEQLMMDYAGGDIPSFEALYEQHRAPLYRYVLRQVKNHQATAEDIFQLVLEAKDRGILLLSRTIPLIILKFVCAKEVIDKKNRKEIS